MAKNLIPYKILKILILNVPYTHVYRITNVILY